MRRVWIGNRIGNRIGISGFTTGCCAAADAEGSAAQGDPLLIKIPRLGLAPDKLQSSRAIEHRTFNRRAEAVGRGFVEKTIFHRHHRDPVIKHFLHKAGHRDQTKDPLLARLSTTMNVKQPGCQVPQDCEQEFL